MTGVFTAIAAILIFCILIFVHELGHFIAAKLLGIRVHEFAIGMGPKLISWGKGETRYSVRALPIGGFCALEGEDERSEDERALSNKPAWMKLIVLVAGSFMNLLLGLLLLFFVFGTAKGVVVPEVASVDAGGAAELAGVVPGDEIVAIDGHGVHIVSDLSWELANLENPTTEMTVLREGEKVNLTVSPQQTDSGLKLGVMLKSEANNFFLTVKSGFYTTVFYVRVVLETLLDLLRGKIGFQSMSGPIGIVSEIGSAVQETARSGWAGFLNLLQLTILLTVNLGVFNLLPVPALDGGRIFFVLVEMVRRKPLPPEKEGVVHLIGFALLILLSLVVAYMDVIRLF